MKFYTLPIIYKGAVSVKSKEIELVDCDICKVKMGQAIKRDRIKATSPRLTTWRQICDDSLSATLSVNPINLYRENLLYYEPLVTHEFELTKVSRCDMLGECNENNYVLMVWLRTG